MKQAPRRQTLVKQKAEEKEVFRMLEQGVISPSNSPWASPTVLVQRKDGRWRYCCDFRLLNNVTRTPYLALKIVLKVLGVPNGSVPWIYKQDTGRWGWNLVIERKQPLLLVMDCLNGMVCHSAYVMTRACLKN